MPRETELQEEEYGLEESPFVMVMGENQLPVELEPARSFSATV